MIKPEIFLSYAWGGESEKIVNELDNAFQQKGIVLVRDKRDLGFKGMITGFMQRMGEGNAVVTVISDEYLKSPYCMFELLEIYRNLRFKERIFPIVLDDAKIYDPEVKLEYLNYWQAKKEKLGDAIVKYGPDAITVIGDDYKIYKKIFDNYGEIVNILKDINALTPEIHRADNFKALIDAVEELINLKKKKKQASPAKPGKNPSPANVLIETTEPKPANLPYHSIGNVFKGRKDVLQELAEELQVAKPGTNAIAIYGLGGVGKTRLAVEYAWKYKKNYTALLFINAGSPEILPANIADLAEPKVLDLPEHNAADQQVKYAAVINWLNQHHGWLMVLDNADTTEAATKVEALLGQLQHGHLLITTRIDSWSNQVKTMRLDVLGEKDAIAFLLETTDAGRTKTKQDPVLAGAIAADLGYLALALEQARAYISTKELSLAAYQKTWELNRAQVLGWFDKRLMQYPASVAITWQTSFEQLSADAQLLLNRLAWLAPDPLPRTLLETEIPGIVAIDMLSAWQQLKQYSLTASNEDKTAFTIHRLVQEVTRNKQDENIASKSLADALKWMDTAFDGDPENVVNWPLLEPLVPHVLYVVNHAEKHGTVSQVSRLINQLAIVLLTKAQYNAAEPLMRRALEIDKKSYGEDHPNVAIRLNNLAQLLQDTNRLAEAEPLMRKALEIDEKNYGKCHSNVAIRLSNLATLLKDTNRLEEAEPLMKKALEIDEKTYKKDHPNVARDLNNLAQLLKATSRLEEAEPLMRRALEIDEKIYGDGHSKVAIRLNNLATLLQATNRFEEAEPLMRRALEIDEKAYRKDHPNVARDLNNFAQLLQATNRFEEAEPLMRRALEIDEKTYMKDHPNVAIDLNNLAQLLKADNRLEEAEPLMRKSVKIFLNSFETDHPNVQKVVKNYMSVLKEMNKTEEEIKILLANLQISQ